MYERETPNLEHKHTAKQKMSNRASAMLQQEVKNNKLKHQTKTEDWKSS